MRHVLLVGAACVAAVFALGGCGTGGYETEGSQGAGKDLFVQRCGGCHTLADAGTAGTIGPNLDDAFAQAREAGMTSDTFIQIIREQVLFPISQTSTGSPGMPGPDETLPECTGDEGQGFCVDDQKQAAQDIAVYVGSVAGTGAAPAGQDATDGATIFSTNCAGCHTLSAAGSSGNVGPNLDDAKPSKALVIDRVTNGKGQMPSFKGTLNQQQIEAVAEYVSSSAGG